MTTTEFEPYRRISAQGSVGLAGEILLICDHASNAVPPWVEPLGLPPEDMARHIAWDVGAAAVTEGLAARLGSAAMMSTFSRLVIDPNRGERDPTLVMKLYDGSIIQGNRRVDGAEIERRLDRLHRPYHNAVADELNGIISAGRSPVIVSVHSFTPQLRGKPKRPWHIGILWDRDRRLPGALLTALRAQDDLTIGDNEPYSGALADDTMSRHATARGIPHALIEIRNDLIETTGGQQAWADRLAPILAEAIAAMRLEHPA